MLLVSSPEPNAARSAFSLDLADVFAQAGHRVLLVDTDLSEAHLSTLVEHQGQATPDTANTTGIDLWSRWQQSAANNEFWSRLQITALKNVRLLSGRHTNGDLPMLVPSLHWPTLVEALRQYADVVIFDGPSTLKGPDAALLAPLVDGVVLALDPKRDRRAAIAETRDRLMLQPGAQLLGAIVAPNVGRQAPPRAKRGLSISVQLGPRGEPRGIRFNKPAAPPSPPQPAPSYEASAAATSWTQAAPEEESAPASDWAQAASEAEPLITPPPAPVAAPLVTPLAAAPLVTPPAAQDIPLITPPPATDTHDAQPQNKKRAGSAAPRARRKRAADATEPTSGVE